MIDDTLPELLQTIEAELGYAAMLKFAHAFGGQRIYIPEKPGPESPITKQLGQELAEKLCKLLGRGDITVPLGPTGNQARFRIALAKRIAEGGSNNEIARDLHCHEVTVRRTKGKLGLGGPDPRQVDLFDKVK
ncbi:helix-turn-helix domain-containing protein [Dongia deserti]|uniref:hypothetical protein n=1 Tax=Dongia deserti TaxID=2268030 RepID=UPI000E64E278|nr:hypothetical protein [Dongia deserti]